MQKKGLIIFSLIVISVLFIAGCQEAVGGLRRLPTSTSTDSTYSTNKINDISLNVGVKSSCEGYGAYVYVDKTCYIVKGCIDVQAKDTYTQSPEGIRQSPRKEMPILRQSGSEIPCAQSSRGSVIILTWEEANQDAIVLY